MGIIYLPPFLVGICLINWTPKHKNMFTEFWWWLKWGLSYSSQKFYFAPSILYSSQCSPFHIQNERRIAHAVIDWALYNARFRIWKRPVQNTFEKQNSAWIPLPPAPGLSYSLFKYLYSKLLPKEANLSVSRNIKSKWALRHKRRAYEFHKSYFISSKWFFHKYTIHVQDII